MSTPRDNEPDDGIETVEAEEVEADGDTIAAEEIDRAKDDGGADRSDATKPASRIGWRTQVAAVVLALVGIAALVITFTWPTPALWLMGQMPAPLPALATGGGGGAARIATLENDHTALKQQYQEVVTRSREQADKQARLEEALAVVNGTVAEIRKTITAQQEANAELAEAVAAQQEANADLAEAMAALQEANAALAEDLTTKNEQPAAADAELLAALKTEIANLHEQLAVQGEQTKDIAGKLAAGSQRLGALEKTAGSDNALILAVGQLQGEIAAGRPFAASLKATTVLAQAAGLDAGAAIAALTPMAGKGVATRQQLQLGFAQTLTSVLASSAAAQQGFWQRTLARITGLVSVRRTGEIAGTDAEAVMARAEVRMNGGDLAGAAKQMAGLDGSAATAAAPWLAAANGRLAAEAATAKLHLLAISSMAKN